MISIRLKGLAGERHEDAAADQAGWLVAAMAGILALTGFYFGLLYAITR